MLAILYKNGKGVVQSDEMALYWLKKSVEHGNDDAKQMLASFSNFDIDTIKKAAENGDAIAQYNLGTYYYEGYCVNKSYTKAVELFKKSANQGYASAQFNLGLCYQQGVGTAQSYKNAVYWYKKAAEKDDVGAQFNLGFCYYNGLGETISYEKATYWYKRAAEKGDKIAQFNLGICYCDGKGVKRDYNEAAYWLNKAARQGHESAKKALNEIRQKSLIKKVPTGKNNEKRSANTTKKHVKTTLSYWSLLFWGIFFIGSLIGSFYLFKSERFDDITKWLFDPQNKISVHSWEHWWYLGMDEITINQSCFTLLTGLRIHPLLFIIQVVAGLAECLWWPLTAILWLISWIILGGGGCILYGLPSIICILSIFTAIGWFRYSSKKAKDIITFIIFILIIIGGTIFTYLQLTI